MHTATPATAPQPVKSTAIASADPRREKRLNIAVPIKVFTDAASHDSQTCCTYEISNVGARLVAVTGVKQVGQMVYLQRQNRRAKYRVVWIGQPGTGQAEQMGVELMDTGSCIWDNELKARLTNFE